MPDPGGDSAVGTRSGRTGMTEREAGVSGWWVGGRGAVGSWEIRKRLVGMMNEDGRMRNLTGRKVEGAFPPHR